MVEVSCDQGLSGIRVSRIRSDHEHLPSSYLICNGIFLLLNRNG